MPERIEVRNLRLAMGGRRLVDALSVAFAAGETWAVLGPNGAGKSTLLATLAGLLPPAAGEIRYGGEPLASLKPLALARRRAYLSQRVDDAFSASVLDTVLLARHPHGTGWGFPDAVDERRAREALGRFDAAGIADRDVRSLSGGERQRVALAACLAQDAPVLLLDEPTTHLDVGHQLQALEVLAGLDSRLVVAVLHDLHLAARYATHALLLDGRGWTLAGPVADVLHEDALARAYGLRFRRIGQDGLVMFWPERPQD